MRFNLKEEVVVSSNLANAISSVVSAYAAPASLPAAVINISHFGTDPLAAIQSSAAVLEGFANLIQRSNPYLGVAIAATGLALDLRNTASQLEQGTISNVEQ